MKNSKKKNYLFLPIIILLVSSFSVSEAATGDFVLIKQLAEISKIDTIIIVSSLIIAIAMIITFFLLPKEKTKINNQFKLSPTKAVVFGALSLSISFILSYVKLFEMPFGGAITFCSSLPIMLYAAYSGPLYGFIAAFSYGILQLIQNAYIIHPVQFFLDYILAFSALGLVSLFKSEKLIPFGILVAGFVRMLCSVISGVVFFAEYAPTGMNVYAYSFIYNFMTLGVDTIICFIVYIIPPVRRTFNRLKKLMYN